MNGFLAGAAAEEHFAVAREFQPIKRLVNGGMRNHLGRWEIHDENLVAAIPAM